MGSGGKSNIFWALAWGGLMLAATIRMGTVSDASPIDAIFYSATFLLGACLTAKHLAVLTGRR